MGSSDKIHSIGMVIIAGLMLLSCWMYWSTPHFVLPPRTTGTMLVAPIQGWHGSLHLLGVTIPNWTAGCCAGALALLSLVGLLGTVRVPAMIPLLLALYGLLHTGALIVGEFGHYIGFGLILAFVCFVILSLLSLRPLLAGIRRITDACGHSPAWSRCRASYAQVVGMMPRRMYAFIMIVLASAAFACCLLLFFYDLRFATLPGSLAKLIPALCLLVVAIGINLALHQREVSTAIIGFLVMSTMLAAMSMPVWFGRHSHQGEMQWHTWFEFDNLH